MSFELPLFPLNVVLFPGMPLPLHIFEPRYRLMIGRCLESDRTFGVTQIIEREAGDAPGLPPLSVGTAAHISEVAPFADGRMNLQTIGTRRFKVLATREQDDYLIGECEWFDDELENETALCERAASARRILSRYFDSLAQTTELPAQLGELDVPQDPFGLSMFIATIMALPNDQKQRLLELASTLGRLEVEEFLLERADIVQRAYAKHAAHLEAQAASDAELGQFPGFVSLN